MALTSVMLFGCFILGFALLYNGSNSYDQIMLGYFVGISFAILLHYNVKVHFKFLPVYLSKEIDFYLRRIFCGFSAADMNSNFHNFYVPITWIFGLIGASAVSVLGMYFFWLMKQTGQPIKGHEWVQV